MVKRDSSRIVLACVDANPKVALLLRAAAAKAELLGVGWGVLYIETADHYLMNQNARERILRIMTLAEEMGAEVYRIEHSDIKAGILGFVDSLEEKGTAIPNIVIGQSNHEGWFAELRASRAEKIARKLRKRNREVQIIPLAGQDYTPSWYDRVQVLNVTFKDLGLALFSVACAYVAAELLRANVAMVEWKVNRHNVTALFLIACVITSLTRGLIPGLLSAILSLTVINYFYFPPFYSFSFKHSGESVSLIVFILSAIIVSLLGGYSRANHAALIRKERRSQALYDIHRIASHTNERSEVLPLLHEQLTRMLEMEIAFFLPDTMAPDKIRLIYPEEGIKLSADDKKMLDRCWQEMRAYGYGAKTRLNSNWRFEPMMTSNGEVGVIGAKVSMSSQLDASFGRLFAAIADQSANILERIEMARMMSESQVREEREKLRVMLLSSVSHDLKTPLASIIGALSLYRRMRCLGKLQQETADELTETALDEAQRLDSFITNILDMTRIESGGIRFAKEWVAVEEPVQKVVRRLRQRLLNHSMEIVSDVPEGLEVEIDPMMTEQVLQNVIDNAIKYSPRHTKITVSIKQEEGGVLYTVLDQGAGIPEDKLEAIFDKYERLRQSDRKVAGTGLGLAISRAVMQKQNGTIEVCNNEAGGAEFRLWFPTCRIVKERRELNATA